MEHAIEPLVPPSVPGGESFVAPERVGRPHSVRRAIAARPLAGRRRSIRLKLFALLLAQSLFVVIAFAILIVWAFNRGYAQYMTAYDDQRAHDLARMLETEYAQDRGWQPLVATPRRWAVLAMTAAGHHVADPAKLEQVFQQFQASDFPESIPAPLPLRFVLLDAREHQIIGSMTTDATLRELPIRYQGAVVGTLGFMPYRETPYDIQFRQRLKTALGSIIAVSVLMAMVPALFIARLLTRAIRAIGGAARQLATGGSGVRLPVNTNDELGELASDFNELSGALERNQNLQRQWLAEISHELRTPVQILMSETEAVVDGVRAPSREGFKSLYDESHRLSRLIDDLHQLSLLDGGMARLKNAEVRVADLLRDCIDSEVTRFRQRDIKVRNELDAMPGLRAVGDVDRLRQVFMNLLENSLRYTDAGGLVRISGECRHDTVLVRFEDSSPGVAEHEIQHLFERLYRGESSRNRASGGAGLGLSIVQSIVLAHGGSIVASPSPLGGLRFDIQLRRAG